MVREHIRGIQYSVFLKLMYIFFFVTLFVMGRAVVIQLNVEEAASTLLVERSSKSLMYVCHACTPCVKWMVLACL